MPFHTEPDHYVRTGLADLQGAWGNLRASVVERLPFPDGERLLFHIDEGMSWDSVRDLDRMGRALLLVRNLAAREGVPEEVREWVEMLDVEFEETVEELGRR